MSDTTNAPAEKTPVRKVSVKTVYGSVKPPADGEPKITPLIQVIGQAIGIKTGETDFGPYTALVGNFEAVNMKTGEIFYGPQCFLPEPFNEMIANKLKSDETQGVDFALEIGVRQPTETENVKYVYVSKPIHDPSAADPLEHLRKRLPALAPPETEDKKGTTAAAGKKK
jgi:hypothetical protein